MLYVVLCRGVGCAGPGLTNDVRNHRQDPAGHQIKPENGKNDVFEKSEQDFEKFWLKFLNFEIVGLARKWPKKCQIVFSAAVRID